MNTVGKGERETNGECSINLYALSHVKYIAGEKLLYNTGNPDWRSVMTQRGGIGEGEGRLKMEGDICIIMADFHCL